MTGDSGFGPYRSTLLGATLVAVGNVFGALRNLASYGSSMLAGFSALHALFAGALALVVLHSRGRWRTPAYELVFAACLAPFVFDLWLPPIYDMRAGSLEEPFFLHHLALVGIALLAPTLRSGIAALTVFLIHALVLWRVLAHGEDFASLHREPWFTLLAAGAAFGFLWSRIARRELAARVARAEAHAEAMTRFGRVMLGLRDRANTPLQSLVLAADVLEADPCAAPDVVVALRQAVTTLVDAQRVVAELAPPQPALAIDIDLERSVNELLEAMCAAQRRGRCS